MTLCCDRAWTWTLAVLLVAAGTGCSTRHYIDDADREVAALLAEGQERVIGNLEERVVRPHPPDDRAAEDDGPTAKLTASRPQVEPLRVDLEKALSIAIHSNRDYLAQKESLYLSGLSLSLTRFNFGPQLSSTVDYVYSDAEDAIGSHLASTGFGASQILPTGGVLSFTSSLAGTFPEGGGGGQSWSGSASVSLSQPLLRGSGYLVSHEALTQGERSFVYALRSFELFRQRFAIDIARTYFSLIRQKQQLDNQEQRYKDAVFDRQKTEALKSVDRALDQDVFNAQRQEVEAEDSLLAARANYKRALDSFKISLGLDITTPVEVVQQEPPYEQVSIDADSAIYCARYNRLDLQTERDQLEDSARGLLISEDDLLPDLSLTASAGLVGSGGRFGDSAPDEYSYSVGLAFEVPLQRKAQRNAYRSAVISHEQAKRSYTLTLDSLELDIRDRLRQLTSTEQRIEIQKQQIRQQARAVAVTQIRFEAGDAESRDLTDARQSLISARNSLISLKVDHFIGRLDLLRALGLLFIDEKGMWK